jgi:phosphoglycerate dehydrogenase-like enzyme
MKPSAFLINVARGPIVDQTALVDALKAGRIRGAGLDVFETEPIPPDDPLLALDNVIVSPHSLSWTDQMFRETGRSAVQSVVDLFGRKIPMHVVNPEVLDHPRVRDWLAG